MRVRKEPRQIIVWEPDHDRFAELIKEGTLSGKRDGSDLVLDGLAPEQVKTITGNQRCIPFKWDRPIIFSKAGE